MTNNASKWEERFEKLYILGDLGIDTAEKNIVPLKDLKEFIRQELTLAHTDGRQAGLKEAEELVRENRKGTFTDDAGDDRWYVGRAS